MLGEKLGEGEGAGMPAVGSAAIGALTPPQHFCSMVVKIIAVQIVAMGVGGEDSSIQFV